MLAGCNRQVVVLVLLAIAVYDQIVVITKGDNHEIEVITGTFVSGCSY